jgi:hypothetical protein
MPATSAGRPAVTPSRGATTQTAFTIVTPVQTADVARLKQYLDTIGSNIKTTTEIRFHDYTDLHYCSLQVIEDSSGKDRPLLVFEGNIDGPTRPFLETLAARNAAFLETVYTGCDGFPAGGSADAVVGYLVANDHGAHAYYVGQPGATRAQIERDVNLRTRVEDETDRRAADFEGLSPDGCRTQLADFVSSEPDLQWVKQPVPLPFRVQYGTVILVGLGIVGFVIAIILPLLVLDLIAGWAGVAAGLVVFAATLIGYLVWLRYREAHDKQDDHLAPADVVTRLQSLEDVQLQNHLVSVTDVKPGWLRMLTLRFVLFAINLLARYIFTQGNLGGIVTIHFARWVILAPPGATRPRLLFLSNYDGSWENYLGEFIDRASAGLTAVWSNTQLGTDRGFPNTRWLFLAGGSRDEQRFKNYARQSQQAGGIWFSAYPSLSVKQVINNSAIRTGVFDRDGDAAGWLRRL